MSSPDPEDIAGPSSRSLLSDVSRKRKASPNEQLCKKITKETQVSSEDILNECNYVSTEHIGR